MWVEAKLTLSSNYTLSEYERCARGEPLPEAASFDEKYRAFNARQCPYYSIFSVYCQRSDMPQRANSGVSEQSLRRVRLISHERKHRHVPCDSRSVSWLHPGRTLKSRRESRPVSCPSAADL